MKRLPRKTSEKSKALQLNIHREFFAQIVSGKKKTEYREQKPHWDNRLAGRTYEAIRFRNGYTVTAPEMLVELLSVRLVKVGNVKYYALQLGKVLKLKRWRTRTK